MNLDFAPNEVQQQLEIFIDQMDRLLHKERVGTYLHGSLAMGDFHIDHSDIDLIVVVKEKLTLEQKNRLVGLMLELSLMPSPIELSVLNRCQLQQWQHPCPYEFHYGEKWREKYKNGYQELEILKDPDLAGHLMVLKNRGIALSGLSIESVFPEIPEGDYLDSILGDLNGSLERLSRKPVYAILNHCRTYAYLCDGQVLTKGEGGDWMLPHVPKCFHKLITEAISSYRNSTAFQEGESESRAFIDWVQEKIDKKKHRKEISLKTRF